MRACHTPQAAGRAERAGAGARACCQPRTQHLAPPLGSGRRRSGFEPSVLPFSGLQRVAAVLEPEQQPTPQDAMQAVANFANARMNTVKMQDTTPNTPEMQAGGSEGTSDDAAQLRDIDLPLSAQLRFLYSKYKGIMHDPSRPWQYDLVLYLCFSPQVSLAERSGCQPCGCHRLMHTQTDCAYQVENFQCQTLIVPRYALNDILLAAGAGHRSSQIP